MGKKNIKQKTNQTIAHTKQLRSIVATSDVSTYGLLGGTVR